MHKNFLSAEDQYCIIGVNDLENTAPDPGELDVFRSFARKYNRKITPVILIPWAMGLLFLLILLKNGPLQDRKDTLALFLICAGFWAAGFLEYRHHISLRARPVKFQKGRLLHTWSMGQSSSRTYYYDVVFPSSGTRFKNAECIKNDQSGAKEYDEILVVSLNGKKAYGCLLPEKHL